MAKPQDEGFEHEPSTNNQRSDYRRRFHHNIISQLDHGVKSSMQPWNTALATEGALGPCSRAARSEAIARGFTSLARMRFR